MVTQSLNGSPLTCGAHARTLIRSQNKLHLQFAVVIIALCKWRENIVFYNNIDDDNDDNEEKGGQCAGQYKQVHADLLNSVALN